MAKVIGILSLVLVVLYWSHTQRLKQLAVTAARKRCREAELQFLDYTVVLNKLSFRRDKCGRWCLQREYQFDFTSTGEQRYQGKVIVQGHYVVAVELEAYLIN